MFFDDNLNFSQAPKFSFWDGNFFISFFIADFHEMTVTLFIFLHLSARLSLGLLFLMHWIIYGLLDRFMREIKDSRGIIFSDVQDLKRKEEVRSWIWLFSIKVLKYVMGRVGGIVITFFFNLYTSLILTYINVSRIASNIFSSMTENTNQS